MSSGTLPLACYHRADALNSGSYGAVIAAYDDEGNEFAMKLFNDDNDDEEEAECGISLGERIRLLHLRYMELVFHRHH